MKWSHDYVVDIHCETRARAHLLLLLSEKSERCVHVRRAEALC